MSYALFWIETLVVTLLWAGTGIAIAARVRRSLGYGLLAFVIVWPPLLILGSLSFAAGLMKVAHINPSRFGYCLSLTIVCFIGICVLLHLASRRLPEALPRSASAWPVGRLALALLVAAGVWAMTLWNMDLAVRTQMLALRAEAGASMLSVAPPVVNDAQNAALVYEQAFRRIDADKSLNSRDATSSPQWQDKPDFADPAVSQLLSRHAETLALLKRAAELPDCHFDHDFARPWISIVLPELQWLRISANLLQFHARQQLSQGQIDAAIDDVDAMLRISEHTGRDPFLLNALVSIGIEAMAIHTLEEELLPAISTPQQVLKLKLGNSERMARMLRRAMTTEEAFGMATFCDLVEGRITLELLVGNTPGDFLSPQCRRLLFRVFLLGDDVLAYRQAMSQNRQLALKPYYEVHELLSRQQTERVGNRERGILTAVLMPAITPIFHSVAGEQARLEGARIGLAIARYRMEHGQLPARLEDLCPAYLNEIPTDPFDGQPMRLKIEGEQAVVYSVGPDQKDDGGVKSESRGRPGDISFQVKKRKA
ncbi:MAG: hypothetical protein ACM359_08570 [Bacillota bacterium]